MANPPRHFMAQTSCVIKYSPKEWDYEKDTINSLNSHPQLRSLGLSKGCTPILITKKRKDANRKSGVGWVEQLKVGNNDRYSLLDSTVRT